MLEPKRQDGRWQRAAAHGVKTVGEIADVRQHALGLGTDQGVRWLWVAAIGVGPEEKYQSTGSAD